MNPCVVNEVMLSSGRYFKDVQVLKVAGPNSLSVKFIQDDGTETKCGGVYDGEWLSLIPPDADKSNALVYLKT